MQPELNELSQNTSLTYSTPDTNHESQHGLYQPHQRPPPQPGAGEGRLTPRRSASDTASSTPSGRDLDEVSERALRRLSPSSAPHSRSPVDRIIEYERASTNLPKGRNEGPAFTLVQRCKKSGYDRVALLDFPNGSFLKMTRAGVANFRRGINSYTISSPPCFSVRCCPSVPTVPSIGHNAARVEDCLFAFLSGK